MFATYTKQASVVKRCWYTNHLVNYQVVDMHLKNQVQHYESRITMFGLGEQASPIF
jgi:hypothetical protein